MNLDQITTKCWILALFIRDDGERLLLGDGWFDFKDSLQHFQPNSIANDIVELQGTDGQLLAGQVRRSASQSFDGYVGDALTSKTEIENRRRQFIQFFRTRRHYKVIYIFPDGTAIQRRMGYLTDAPSVPEMWQKFPEYHVALNFEDVNYYEYAEDAQGDEIYAHAPLVKLISVQSGGLIWDENGAVSHGYTWLDPQTVTGDYITVTDGATGSPLTLSQLTGNATQDGTPTPDAPVAINTVTGEQTVKVVGKNLFKSDIYNQLDVGGNAELQSDGYYKIRFPSSKTIMEGEFQPNTQYTISAVAYGGASGNSGVFGFNYTDGTSETKGINQTSAYNYTLTSTAGKTIKNIKITYGSQNVTYIKNLQLELGSQASDYQPYQGQSYEVNLGKNLLQFVSQDFTITGVRFYADNGSLKLNGTSTAEISTTNASYKSNLSFSLKAGTYTYSCSDIPSTLNIRLRKSADDTQLAIVTASSKTATFTLDEPTQVYIGIYVPNNTTFASLDLMLMLEAGTQATSFSPYFTPIELAKIGTYQDRIYKTDGKWYIEKQVGKVVFDGTEDGWMSEGGGAPFRIPMPDFFRPSPQTILAICDHFESVPYNANWNNYTSLITINATGSATAFKFRYTAIPINSLADWKIWLSTHNTTVYYVLTTPTTTEITDETLLAQLNFIASLYEGVNNISIVPTGGAQGEMTLNYYADVDTTGAGYEWEAGEGGGPTIVQVIGVDNAQPIWTVTGPATNPTLTNITTIQTITWNGTVPNGQKLIVDMANQTATLAGANVYEFITGSWLTLRPGANKLTYSAQGADQASRIEWNGVVG